MGDLVNISIGAAGVVALLGYVVVFFEVFLLMLVVLLLGRIMKRKTPGFRKKLPEGSAEKPVLQAEKDASSVGEVDLYGVHPRDAAVIMAIVANRLGKPLQELHFKSIKEVK